MNTLLIAVVALLVPMLTHAEEPAPAYGSLEIQITNIENSSGTVYIAVVDSPDNWLKSDADYKPFLEATKTVSSTDDLLVSIEALPPGKYAISLFHDLDGDAEMDTNFVGFPKEPFGFSAPMGKFGPPKFDEAATEHSEENSSVTITLN